MRSAKPRRRPFIILVAIMAAVATMATACTVEPASDQLTLDPDVAAALVSRQVNDGALDNLPTNDEGDELLPRVLTGSFKTDDCDFVDMSELPEQPECGWLTRPLHGAYTADIELPTVIFKATGPDPSSVPLIYLHGGPSDGFLSYLEFPLAYELIVEPFIETRDVIIFDQRGTGLAEPNFGCDGEAQWYNSLDEDPDTFVSRRANTCATALRLKGIRLDQFSRQSSADDVMVLARELGHDSVDLHGSSWGGILAYTVMQLHPNVVRAAVLDSPLSIETDLTGSMPGSFHEAMQAMQVNCDLSASCAGRHGDIIARYIRVFEALEERPAQIVLGGIYHIELTADDLSYLLFALFYSPEAIAKVPDLLLDLENGNVSLLQDLTEQFGWGWGVDFTFLTYMCTDIVSASDPAEVASQQIGIEAFDRVDDAPDGRGHTAQAMCERMQVRPPAAPRVREAVPTTPTIVFAGAMDPITPFTSGQQIIEDLPNGFFVGFNDLSHGVTSDPCANTIVLAFLDDPTTEPDLTCSLPENRAAFEFVRVAHTAPG